MINTYLNNLVLEKGLDVEQILEIEKADSIFGTNFMPLQCVLDAILQAPVSEQSAIHKTLVAIDFKNGDVMHFFKHLAQAIAV